MRNLRGRKALVTGAASGIGRAIALALAAAGVDLYLLDIDDLNLEAAARAARQCGVEVVARHCDLTDSGELAAAVEALLAHWGSLNILINNAGISDRRKTHETTDARWDRIIALDLLAPIALTRKLLPTLLSNQSHVLNVCSIVGLVPSRKIAAYQTSKFGLFGFTAALRAEYVCPDFGVTALCPGLVQTALMGKIEDSQPHKVPPRWLMTTPEYVAKKALAAIRSNRGTVVVPWTAHAGWLLARAAPGLVDFLWRRPWLYLGSGRRRTYLSQVREGRLQFTQGERDDREEGALPGPRQAIRGHDRL